MMMMFLALPALLQGGTLSEKVSAQMISPVRKLYSTAQALGWALDLASALAYLHAKRPMVLHRDVKLSNVVLTEEAGALVAKLADMGLHMVRWWKVQRVHTACGYSSRAASSCMW
jgi:serine/threonine protein kinase